jgi:hypothetical protein
MHFAIACKKLCPFLLLDDDQSFSETRSLPGIAIKSKHLDMD